MNSYLLKEGNIQTVVEATKAPKKGAKKLTPGEELFTDDEDLLGIFPAIECQDEE